ncbi:MAG: hypothetical protein NTU44_02205 [Bacteroidetes bacterium]|nr:hypothetical protein [Bacteroidota bacterium]
MKTRIIFSLIALLIWPASTLKSQEQPEQLNLPGDNLNLYAVMKIFQESETLELFEKRLNEEDTRINNLDLNGDNYIDYIKVVDYVEKNVHYIVLRVAVTLTENQDVAVFIVRKDPDGKTVIQLVGDEALYGKYYIIEPYYATDQGSTPNPGYNRFNNNPQPVTEHHTVVYETSAWPLVALLFLPTYVIWNSPWHYGYYPNYWHPWTPWYWHEYYGYHYYWHDQYYGHYHHGHHNGYDSWHENYYGHHHTTSNTVYTRKERGDYKGSYSKPESIREGSDYFRKTHPEAVKPDMREPQVKDIRVATRSDIQSDKTKSKDKTNIRKKDNPSINKTQPGKPDNKAGNIKPLKTDNKAGNIKPRKTDNKTGNIKPLKTDKPGNINPGKTDNKPGNVKPATPEKKTGVSKTEKAPSVQKANNKATGRPSDRETKRHSKEKPKKYKPKTAPEPGRDERK